MTVQMLSIIMLSALGSLTVASAPKDVKKTSPEQWRTSAHVMHTNILMQYHACLSRCGMPFTQNGNPSMAYKNCKKDCRFDHKLMQRYNNSQPSQPQQGQK